MICKNISKKLLGTKGIRDYRSKYDHYLILVATDSVISEIRKLLTNVCNKENSSNFFECNDSEGNDVLLHRYVAGLAPKRSKIMQGKNSGEVLALDVALPRNCESWDKILPDSIFSEVIESFQMAHFMCMVSLGFCIKKSSNIEEVKV